MILGTICCRGGSKGVPGKNLRLLNGKSLLSYTIAIAKESRFLNDLIISTDDTLIAKEAIALGAKVPFMRPADLATDTASKWPVFLHAVEAYQKLTGLTVSYLVDMDVTVPLKTTDHVDGAIDMALKNPEADVIITGYDPERNPYFNMMEVGNNGFASLVKQGSTPIVRRQDAPLVYSLTPAAYVIKKEALYNFAHWSEAKCKIYPIPRERAVDIDTEMDFKLVEFLMGGNNG